MDSKHIKCPECGIIMQIKESTTTIDEQSFKVREYICPNCGNVE